MLLDGLDTDVEPFGDLPVFQPRHAAQQEDPAALLGKAGNAEIDLIAQLRQLKLLFDMVGDKRANTGIQPVFARLPAPPFPGAQQIDGAVLHGNGQQRLQRPVEVHLRTPFPQCKKNILYDVFRRLTVMDHLKSPCTQGFIVIEE